MKTSLGLALLMFSSSVIAQTTPPPPPPTNLPMIRALLNEDIVCYGYECADVLDQLVVEWQLIHTDAVFSDISIDDGVFCSALNAKKPAGCSLSAVPQAPGITTNWQPNGCGPSDPSWSQTAVLHVVNQMPLVAGYTGNRDEPIAGTSFLNACNRHDQCWGYSFDKGGCDTAFLENMMNDCVYSSNRSSCESAAAIYHVAVSAFGQSAYDKAVSDRTCANWAFDMANNGCAA